MFLLLDYFVRLNEGLMAIGMLGADLLNMSESNITVQLALGFEIHTGGGCAELKK